MSMINLLTETTVWEQRQIAKRAESAVRRYFSRDAELILNRKITGVAQGVYTLLPEEQGMADLFQQCAFQAQTDAREAEADNIRLAAVLDYEQALRDIARLTLLIDGRAEVTAVEEVPEEIDPDTGEILVAYVAPAPAIPAIAPLALTIDSIDETGDPVIIDNPAYIAAVAERDTAQAVIDAASPETLDLWGLRHA
ncbi:hypothetical protein [uncultured Amphritea sp.]|mgnify:CR=1 FL=1|uniref:hypothetical protein n=1 Tax=uncultured Amphritea sp. TaxID=981605 RepID=UPI0025FFE9E9|nr:hypothetical protein [uncultured Amphritea sp.]